MIQQLRNWWGNWDENYKRAVLTLLFSACVVFLAYAIYFVFFKPRPTIEPAAPVALPNLDLPATDIRDILQKRGIPTEGIETAPSGTLPLSKLKPDRVAKGGRTLATPRVYANTRNADIGVDGSIKYYNASDGKYYSLDDKGNRLPLSDQVFKDVQKTTWSPQGASAILEFPDGSNIYYDFAEKKQYTLPREAIGFKFSDPGNQIGYKFITEDPDENWLVVSSPNGDNAIAVEHIGEANPADVLINWSPDNTKVAFYRSSSDIDAEEVFLIGQYQENFKSLKVDGRGFEGIWSPQGTRLLYNVYQPETGYRPELWVTEASDENLGVNKKNLGVRTWVNKCVFSSSEDVAFCAVPLYLPQGTGIYPALANTTADTIYKINTKTSFKQQIAVPTNALGIGLYTAQKLLLSPDEKTLHMVDVNGGIYDITLEE